MTTDENVGGECFLLYIKKVNTGGSNKDKKWIFAKKTHIARTVQYEYIKTWLKTV